MKKIAPDKWKHFYAGIVMGAVVQAFLLYLVNDHLLLSMIISLVVVALVSYGFELFSKITGMGHHDVMDAVASIIGGVIGMAFSLLIHIL